MPMNSPRCDLKFNIVILHLFDTFRHTKVALNFENTLLSTVGAKYWYCRYFVDKLAFCKQNWLYSFLEYKKICCTMYYIVK